MASNLNVPPFPFQSRGPLGIGLVVLVLLSLCSILVSLRAARDSAAYADATLAAGRGRSLLSSTAAGCDVVQRFTSAIRALQALNTTNVDSSSGSSSNSGGGADGSEPDAGAQLGPPQGGSTAPPLPVAACPVELALGVRPSQHTPGLFGNSCEPWLTRRAVLVLQQLLAPGMAGLEWGAGASTLWYLAHLGQLVTVEHSAAWAEQVRSMAHRAFGAESLEGRWRLQVEPPSPAEVLTFAEAESYERFKSYVDVGFLEHDGGHPRFDFIAIDGQARLACFQRAIWLLKPHGGVLVLNNARRRALREVRSLVPERWPTFHDSHRLGDTLIWVSCQAGQC